MSSTQIQIRKRTPLSVILYAMYLYFSGLSFRRTSKALGAAMRRSHTSIWKWAHRYRYSPVLGSFDVNRGSVRSIS
ncbi:MAG: hypothetical protein ACP5RJ_03840 [Conexivisphaera sp.]|jgi:hypothetical protein